MGCAASSSSYGGGKPCAQPQPPSVPQLQCGANAAPSQTPTKPARPKQPGGVASQAKPASRACTPDDANATHAAAATASTAINPEVVLGTPVHVNRCPFMHGSVGAGPFPGYVHGKNPGICPAGCKPDPLLDKHGRAGETPLQTLLREALEYQDIYHRDRGSAPHAKEARIQEVLDEVRRTGTYTHTPDELQHGARLAWRNAPKCSNRKFWEELHLIDARKASTPDEMYAGVLEMLERATLSCVTTTSVVVYRAQTPGTNDGPRVWNSQIIRFAGYRQADGTILGDPAELEFTEMCTERFGWQPPKTPPTGTLRQRFDTLPVLLQAHVDQPPKMFELPEQYVVRVRIRHPDNEAISAMGLQWYAVPAVSSMELSVGGLTYTGCPFNGWYADTEITRNLTDETRFNVCMPVAKALGLDVRNNASMWRDKAITEVVTAVMHSFREAAMGMVDHHTLSASCLRWYQDETKRRGFAPPGNWKWMITPISPTSSPCYLQLNEMKEFTLKPGYWYGPGWRSCLRDLDSRGLLLPQAQLQTSPATDSEPDKPAATMSAAAAAATAAAPAALQQQLSTTTATTRVLILYATVTGNTQQYALDVGNVLGAVAQVTTLSMEEFEADAWSRSIRESNVVALMSSTYGPGTPPGTATKFLAWLQSSSGEAQEAFKGRSYCVLGLGDSCYPRFCAAADLLHSLVQQAGGASILPVQKADALAGEELAVWGWARALGEQLVDRGWVAPRQMATLVKKLPVSIDSSVAPAFQPEFRVVQLPGGGLRPARQRGCHWGSVVEARELGAEPAAAAATGAAAGAAAGAAGDAASTRLIKLDIANVPCGNYHAGDEICIWGENDPLLVERYARNLGIANLDDMLLMQSLQDGDHCDGSSLCGPEHLPLPNSFRTILTRHVGLSERLSFAALSAFAALVAPEDSRLQQLAAKYDNYAAWITTVLPRWQDLFDLFPALTARVPLAMFFQLAPPLKPRCYSVSSSSAVTPTEVAITVVRLAYQLPSGGGGATRDGFCSTFLCKAKAGDRLRFKLMSLPAFRLPLNPASPVVMVASGSGLAPFRGFWQERLLRKEQGQQLGPAVLLYGCRSRESDLIYKAEMDAMVAQGVLTRVILALSREPGVPRTYVQEAATQHAEVIQPLLSDPRCHVYVCGSSNMAQEVSDVLADVAGKAALEAMVLQGRYHEDVFGIIHHRRPQRGGQQVLQGTMLGDAADGGSPTLTPQ